MRILFIQKIKAFAGSEKYLTEVIPALIKRGYDCKFIYVIHPEDESKLAHFRKVLEDKKIPNQVIFSKKGVSLKLLRQLNKAAKAESYDLIHLHLIHAELWFALLKKIWGLKTQLVSTIHGFDESYQAEHGFNPEKVTNTRYIRILKFTEKYISNYFAVSHGLYNLVVGGRIIPEKKMRVINYGFDYPSTTNSVEKNPDEKIILVPGRIVPYKGQDMVIEMLPQLLKKNTTVKVLFAGDYQGEFIDRLKGLVNELELRNHVDFLGHVSNIGDYFQKADLVILPSKSEGFGLVLLEAFNYKKPVVTFDVPAFNTTIKHEKTGLITPCFDLTQLAENVHKVLNDAAFANTLIDNAYNDLISYYCLERMVNETVDFYTDCINQ